MNLDFIQSKVFKNLLDEMNACYDAPLCLMHEPFSSPGYHTRLTGGMVHPTRENLRYAIVLLASGEERFCRRAQEVISAVIALQDQNPGHDTFGIWPWFYEEPLSEMDPPDWNWADFCGKALCVILREYGSLLEAEVRAQILSALDCACHSIIRRDADVSYTNVALMDCYVTILAGEFLKREDFVKYGREKLKKFRDTAVYNGGFAEYNSPTYTMVALGDLSAMQNHIQDSQSAVYIRELAEMEWKCIAEHFHVKTGQWAGPHSRCYQPFLESGLAQKIQKGVPNLCLADGEEMISALYGSQWRCPDDLQKLFFVPRESFETKRFVKDGSTYLAEESCYIHPDYTLGSFAVSDFWEQRQNVVSYYGDRENPAYMRLRVLHDGRDFTAAELNAVQNKNTLLAGIHFASDAGDEHLVFNKIQNHTIWAEDIRIRFVFGGFSGELPQWQEDHIQVSDRGIQFSIFCPCLAFGNGEPRFEVTAGKDVLYVDAVLYHDKKKEIHLNELEKACAVIALQVGPMAEQMEIAWKMEKEKVWAKDLRHGLFVEGACRCKTEQELRKTMCRKGAAVESRKEEQYE